MSSNEGQEEFILKWNEHHNSFFTIMQELIVNESLTDVTIACGGQIFETHKLMLCVCSTFFRQILTRRPDKHPIVFLKDVNPRHMELLLQYMYNGEINVHQDDLGPLIETARSLQVKGLADSPGEEKKQNAPSKVSGPPPLKKARGAAALPALSKPAPLTTSHLANRLMQPRSQDNSKSHKPDTDASDSGWTAMVGGSSESQDGDGEEEYRVYPDTDMAPEDEQEEVVGAGGLEEDGGKDLPLFQSADRSSSQTFQAMPTVVQHRNDNRRHECVYCGKKFPTPSKLNRHELVHTGEKPYPCHLCLKGFTQLTHLKNHLRFSHKIFEDQSSQLQQNIL